MYWKLKKEFLVVRNVIFVELGIFFFENNGFVKLLFLFFLYGRNNFNDYIYELCRLFEGFKLELIEIYIFRGDKWIKIFLNIFELFLKVNLLVELKEKNCISYMFFLNSEKKMRLRMDDSEMILLICMLIYLEYKFGRYFSENGFKREENKLWNLIEKDMNNIDMFVNRWYELYSFNKIDWEGNIID